MRKLVFSWLLTIPVIFQAQSFSPLHNELEYQIQVQTVLELHSAIKPYSLAESFGDTGPDSINCTGNICKPDVAQRFRFCFGAIPLVNMSLGYETEKKELLHNLGYGINLEGTPFHAKFHFSLNFYAQHGNAPSYADSFMRYARIVPGTGRAFGGDTVFTSEFFNGYLSFSPNKIFNFRFGKGKHFLGDGYRSLFLSDVAAAYPYLAISAKAWKLKYECIYAMHTDMSVEPEFKSGFKKKFATTHFLSWNATKKWNFNLFEALVWQGTDTNRVRNFEVNYLNPVIFLRPVEYSLGSSDNAFLGFGWKNKTCRYFHWYGQLLLDEFLVKEIRADISEMISPDDTIDSGWWANKYGFQVGWKAYDVFKIKDLYFQQEFNLVRPFTYAHGSTQQNYGHMNQSLAHPLGSNFYELVNLLRYSSGKWRLNVQFNYAVAGRDSAGMNFGGNIFKSYASRAREYGNYNTQGLRSVIKTTEVVFSRMLIPMMRMEVQAGFVLRSEKNDIQVDKNTWFWLGIRTQLWNEYRDFW